LGAKGLPFSMPTAAKSPSEVGSSDSLGSFCTTSLNIFQKLKSTGETVLIAFPVMSGKVGVAGLLPKG